MPIKKVHPELERQSQQIFKNGLALLKQSKAQEADELFVQAHQLNPNNLDVLNILGIRFYQKQDYKNALYFLKSARVIAPHSSHTLSNLGLVHIALLEFEDALECCDQAIEKSANIPEAHNNRGNALKGLARYQEAIKAYQQALTLRPNYAEALSNQGVVLLEQNMPEKAIQLFEKAITANPRLASAFNSLGNAFTQLGNQEGAFQSFERALEINPNYLDACLNFGISLQKFKHYEGAVQCYRHALKMDSQHAKTFYLLGETYYETANCALAKTYLAKSLSLNPSDIESQYALAISQIPKLPESEGQISISRKSFANELVKLELGNPLAIDIDIASKLISRHPFYLAYQAENNKSLLSRFGNICTKQAEIIQNKLTNSDRETKTHNKIRIGIISHFLCDHPVWHAITKGWVHHLNADQFEIHLFNTGGSEDNETQLAKEKISSYQNCGDSVVNVGQLIIDQNLDVVLYPEVGMDTTCKALACLRLAPVQAVSWGHPETTGLPTLDFYLSGELLEPTEASQNYSEELIKLPNLGTYFESPTTNHADPNLEELGINPSIPILLCAGSPSKYTPNYDQNLIAIAKNLGDCQFVFFNFEENLTGILKERLRQAFLDAKLNPDGFIKFIPFLKKNEFNGLMKKADLYLDTIGFSGFNTAMQAIMCDLPVVTIEGNWMRGRLASAILGMLGTSKLICHTNKAFIDTVTQLIQNPSLLRLQKTNIATRKNILFNDLTAIRALENFLRSHTNINGQ